MAARAADAAAGGMAVVVPMASNRANNRRAMLASKEGSSTFKKKGYSFTSLTPQRFNLPPAGRVASALYSVVVTCLEPSGITSSTVTFFDPSGRIFVVVIDFVGEATMLSPPMGTAVAEAVVVMMVCLQLG